MWASGHFGYLLDYLWWWIVPASLVGHTWCFFRLWPKKRRRTRHLILGNVLLMLCGLSLVGLAGESYLRFGSVETDTFGLSLSSKRWVILYEQLNSCQYRDREWRHEKSQGVHRIAFIGDSFTYGWGIKNVDDRFTGLLDARFTSRDGPTVEVMTIAAGGLDTRDHAKIVDRMIAEYDVDEIVLCVLPNDIEQLLPTTDDFDPIHPRKSTYINTDSSFLLDFLYHRVFVRRGSGGREYFDWLADGFADPGIWRQQQDRFANIVRQCRKNQVELRVVLLPFVRTAGDQYQPAAIHARLREFFELNNVPVADMLPTLRGIDPSELVVNRSDAHPNERAHALFADAIWRQFYAR